MNFVIYDFVMVMKKTDRCVCVVCVISGMALPVLALAFGNFIGLFFIIGSFFGNTVVINQGCL